MVVFAKFGGTTALALLEDAVEIAEVVEATTVTDLSDGAVAVNQLSAGMAQTKVDDVLAEVATRMELEEAAERRGTHAGDVGQLGKADLVAVVGVDEGLHLMHAAAVAGHLDLGEARGGERTGTLAARQFVEDGEELHEGIESVLDAAERVELTIDLHNGVEGEAEALLRLDHHLLHRVEGVTVEDGALAEVDVELDGDLADVVALAVALLPDVFKVWTGDEHEVEVADYFAGVADDAAHTGGMLDEVELIDLMIVDGIGELLLPPVGDVKDVLAHQGRYLVDDRAVHQYFSSFRISDMRWTFLICMGTRGRRSTFWMKPISESIALTPAGLPSTKRSEKRSVKR